MVSKKKIYPNDRLSRFIRHKSSISISKGEVKYKAFMPPADKNLSVFHTEHVEEIEIWSLADKYFYLGTKFRADIRLKNVKNAGLNVDFDNVPPLHANIIGWPDEKDIQMLRAMELASSAELKTRSQD